MDCCGPGWIAFPSRRERTIWYTNAMLSDVGYTIYQKEGKNGLHLEAHHILKGRPAYLTQDDVRGLVAGLTKWLEEMAKE